MINRVSAPTIPSPLSRAWRKILALSPKYWVIGLLLAHGLLTLNVAWRTSPVWDEIVYPAAGYDLLCTGTARVSLDHPPLGKILMALPLLPFASKLKSPPTAMDLDAYRFGFQFLYGNNVSAGRLMLLSRASMIAVSVALAIVIYLGASSAWGVSGGFTALVLYLFSPPVLARASLGLLEMPLALFMTSALWCYIRRRDSGQTRYWWGWAFFLTCALWTKATAFILIPSLLLCDSVLPMSRENRLRCLAENILAMAFALCVCELLSRLLGASYITTQIWQRKADLAASRFPFYFHGVQWEHASWYFSAIAWLIKTPLAVTLLAGAGFVVWFRRQPASTMLWAIACLMMVTSLTMVCVRSLVATAHYFYLYPCLAWLGSAVLSVKNASLKWIARGLLASVLIGAIAVHPNDLAYFNILVGGSSQGYRWLADSDQDWGQGLPALAHWIRREGLSQILLSYSGAGDPRVYGISYQDVFSPALITASYKGEVFSAWPDRIVMAIGTKVYQTEPELLGWLLKNRKPMALVGDTFLIYDLTGDREVLLKLSTFYRVTHRPASAVAFSQS